MEQPQPRPYGTQGKKPTHDFLSLYSPGQQDLPSSTHPGVFLETHDFLQPLEQTEGKNKLEEPTSAVEHILPGGIGTYSISHISSISQSQSRTQRKAKDERIVIRPVQSSGSDKNDENSNSNSYTGNGFSLWEESAVKGKTGKENIARNTRVIREGSVMKTGEVPWITSMERASQSSSTRIHQTATTTISSISSSCPTPTEKNPIFVDVLKFAKSSQDDEQEFVIKQEPSSHYKGVLSVKVDTAHHDQKPNTPRSKHSATEQRRRSKINDRFLRLRELIPHADQKRDKASFLLEVIEYVRFLQEKAHMYEDSFRNNNKNSNNQRPTEGLIHQPLVNKGDVSINLPKKSQTALDSDLSSREQMSQLLSDKLTDEEVTIESGTISISTIYSQGLLSTLTQALQNSGVDLSQANISVQIDLGKRSNSSTPILKKNEVFEMDETFTRSRLASTREENSDPTLKRFKMDKN